VLWSKDLAHVRGSPAVHEIPHEDVRALWQLTACLQQLEQVMELPMDVSTHLRDTA
jgi:hypothetical protein